MDKKDFHSLLSEDQTYSRQDLLELYQRYNMDKEDPDRTAFRRLTYALLLDKLLYRSAYDTYTITEPQLLPVYCPQYTEESKALTSCVETTFPELSFVVFEATLLNEFLGRQIGPNTHYLQVEKDVSGYVFDTLRKTWPGNILYNPTKKEFGRYWSEDCVVIQDMISQAPMSHDAPHAMVGEKMLVDAIAEPSIALTMHMVEAPELFRSFQSKYQIDQRKIHRYAGRRGKAALVAEYLGDNEKQ